MGGAFKLATIRGIPIRIHFSFLLVLPFLALLFGRVFSAAAQAARVPPEQLTGSPWLWGLGLAVSLFLAVLVHELAHALYAIKKGGKVTDITLLMIGGVSRISELPQRSKHEGLMALAGPLTSLLLGGVFLGLYALLAEANFNLRFAFFYLGQLNLFLGAFNLLPAFPMDGGRILRSALTGKLGRVRATRVAGMFGKGFALLFGIFGLLSFNIILLLIAFFVYMGAEAETRQVLMEAALGHVRVRDLMSPRTSSIPLGTEVEEVARRMKLERRLALPVVDETGNAVGVVTLRAVKSVPADRRNGSRVDNILSRVEPVTPEDEVWKALRLMSTERVPQLPVVEDGRLVGTLTQIEILRGLELRELEEERGAPPAWTLSRRGASET
ncbi:MAG: M50 family metallopeptidase [Myxococcota bacterium]